ncbi:hypothetical protein EIMP300_07370 [Escherichia coli]|uniref:DUF112 domain-containing protein n=1 Tax=Escherichia coli TaxID=562 RepID=A0A8S0FEU9_ECOLX|nr:hypothetical protein EIMP300_07370 [Escherichia coli]
MAVLSPQFCLKIPGTPAAAATAIDGYELTKQQGKAGLALSAATFSSFSGGTLSIIVLMFLSPVLASWALKFSASESFALATFGLSIIASISGESLIKGLIAGVGGLLIATIGLDPMGGFPRFTGGFVELMNVPFIPVMIGLFAASEAFRSMEQNQQIRQGAKVAIGSLLLPWQTLRRIALTILRSSGLGVFIGMIPGASCMGRILQLLLPITKLVVSVRHQKTLVRVKLKLWPPVRQARMAAPVAHCYLC